MKITAKFVENITAAGKYYDQHGLFLHVRPSGAKKWLQRYTFNGRRREIGLGSAKIVSVATARKNAYQNLVLVSDGIDPIENNESRTKQSQSLKRQLALYSKQTDQLGAMSNTQHNLSPHLRHMLFPSLGICLWPILAQRMSFKYYPRSG